MLRILRFAMVVTIVLVIGFGLTACVMATAVPIDTEEPTSPEPSRRGKEIWQGNKVPVDTEEPASPEPTQISEASEVQTIEAVLAATAVPDTPVAKDTLQPTDTPTPQPTGTPIPPGVGATFRDGDFALTLVDVVWGGQYEEGGTTWTPAVRFGVKYTFSGTGQHLLRFSKADFRLTDDVGTQYYLSGKDPLTICIFCADQAQPFSLMIKPGDSHFVVPFGKELSDIPDSASVLILSVENFDNQIPYAEWHIPIP